MSSNFKTIILLAFTSLVICSCAQEELPIPEGVTRYENFKSKYVDSRNIDIYLPKAYHKKSNAKFPVIYMHDGQMLFDTVLCWNGKTWDIDNSMEKSAEYGFAEPAIIVGIWNTEKRWEEYMPQDVFSYLADEDQKEEYTKVVSNEYLKFIVEELKPEIDKNFRTKTDKDNTIIMGSSMGGLISWYGLLKYPSVFGKAGCLSTHWPGVSPKYKHPLPVAIRKYFLANLPKPGDHLFYFDYGSETLDKYYQPYQYAIDTSMIALGYKTTIHFMSKEFPGEAHDEIAWGKRVQFPIEYFLKKQPVVQ